MFIFFHSVFLPLWSASLQCPPYPKDCSVGTYRLRERCSSCTVGQQIQHCQWYEIKYEMVCLIFIYVPVQEYFAHLETSPLPLKDYTITVYVQHLWPLTRVWLLSCHTCDKGPVFLWSHPKNLPSLVTFYQTIYIPDSVSLIIDDIQCIMLL